MNKKHSYPKKSKEEKKLEIEELAKKIDEGVKNYLSSDKYKELLNNFSNFHRYSLNNCVLIGMQKPNATQCASFSVWNTKFHRKIESGQKGIKILCPVSNTAIISKMKTDPVTKTPIVDSDGNKIQEEVEVQYTTFKVGYVFDVSQTKPDPDKDPIEIEVTKELKGDVKGFANLLEAVKKVSDSDVEFGSIAGNVKGYYSPKENLIMIKEGMDQTQTLKTLIHELTHSKLHGPKSKLNVPNAHDREIQAESCAYIICNHFGVDTSDYSFPYIGSWSAQNAEDIKNNLEVIKEASASIIDSIEIELKSIKIDPGLEKETRDRKEKVEEITKRRKHKHKGGL